VNQSVSQSVSDSSLSFALLMNHLNSLLSRATHERANRTHTSSKGFAYADVTAATADAMTGELADAFHNPLLNDLARTRRGSEGGEGGGYMTGYDIHMDVFQSYTHFLAALASATGGAWCDPEEVAETETGYPRRGKAGIAAIARLYSNARGEYKDVFVRKDPDERDEL
jgi:hypothetical protein